MVIVNAELKQKVLYEMEGNLQICICACELKYT
jgi:hypothetical protein